MVNDNHDMNDEQNFVSFCLEPVSLSGCVSVLARIRSLISDNIMAKT